MLQVTCRLCFSSWTSAMASSHKLPGFVFALAGNPAPVQSTVALRNVNRFGVLLGQLEDGGREDTWVAGFVRASLLSLTTWPASSLSREVLVMLHEVDVKKSEQRGASLCCHSYPRTLTCRIPRGASSENKLCRQCLGRGWQGTC